MGYRSWPSSYSANRSENARVRMTRESKEEQKKFEDFDGGEGSGGVSGKSVSRFLLDEKQY